MPTISDQFMQTEQKLNYVDESEEEPYYGEEDYSEEQDHYEAGQNR